MSKASEFRDLLFSDDLTLVMETFNGISAKIVEEAGFKCAWASGLSISASMGMRDCNELTATQTLDIVEYIVDAVSIPVLFDGDTGYGDFNDVRLLVKKLSKLGVVGLTIEDMKTKTSSYAGVKTINDLETIRDFCGKIKAAKDTHTDPDFTVIARIHSLICGASMDETVERAVAYDEAGADAIFIHSNKNTPAEIFTFANIWHNKLNKTKPLIISPVSYFSTSMDEFRKAKIAMMIIAAYNMRASIKNMRDVSKRIHDGALLMDIEKDVAPLKDIFTLVDNDELLAAEKKYKN